MPSRQTKKDIIEVNQIYRNIFDKVLHESKFVWDVSGVFLPANTVLIGFIGLNFATSPKDITNNLSLLWFFRIAPLFGIVFSLLWLSTLYRESIREQFWNAKARKFEKDHHLFKMFSGDAYQLSEGGVVEIDGHTFDLKCFGLIHLPSRIALTLIIYLYIIIYILMAIISWNIFYIPGVH